MASKSSGEGGLEAPIRHPIDWKNPEFYDQQSLLSELERVFRPLSWLPAVRQFVQCLSDPV